MAPETPGEPLTYAAALLLGVLQGVTEFLPVSSSGHLALAQHLGIGGLRGRPGAVAFDLLLHLATVCIVVRAFWSDIRMIAVRERRLLGLLFLGSIPAGLVGILFRHPLESLRASPFAVCAALLVTAGALLLCERTPTYTRALDRLLPRGALVIGLAQALSLVPGVSRSGLTISGGVMSGLNRSAAVRFSFLLMIPAVLGASALDLYQNPESWENLPSGPAIAGFAAALVTGAGALALLRILVEKRRLTFFAAYCAALAIAGFIYFSLDG